MPRARVSTATEVNPRLLSSIRIPYPRSLHRVSIFFSLESTPGAVAEVAAYQAYEGGRFCLRVHSWDGVFWGRTFTSLTRIEADSELRSAMLTEGTADTVADPHT